MVAKYAFAPSNVDELALEKGDLITILGRPEPEWFDGRNARGERGLFPRAYVKLPKTKKGR